MLLVFIIFSFQKNKREKDWILTSCGFGCSRWSNLRRQIQNNNARDNKSLNVAHFLEGMSLVILYIMSQATPKVSQ